MFKYLVGYVLFSALIGIILIENGAYSVDTGELGHPNGAWLAYAAHCVVLLTVTFLTIKKKIGSRRVMRTRSIPLPRFVPLAYVVLAFNLLFLVVMLLGAGGIAVLRGDLIKQEFRAGLNYMGAIAHWITYYFAPSLLAYLSFVFAKGLKSPKERILLGFNFAVCSFIGLTWGFKATALMVLFPSLLILYWKISFRQVLLFSLIACVALTGTFILFDRTDESLTEAVTILAIRATVVQGDVAWSVWDMYKDQQKFPPYFPTLYAAIGDRLFSLLSGIDKSDYSRWVDYHFDLQLTAVGGIPLYVIEGGHNITGTSFSEGIFALGSPGYLLFSVLSGLCLGICFNVLKAGLRNDQFVLTAIFSTYFCFPVLFSWLNGGGVTQLFHISVFLGFLMTYGLIRICMSFSGYDRRTFLSAPYPKEARGPRGPLLEGSHDA